MRVKFRFFHSVELQINFTKYFKSNHDFFAEKSTFFRQINAFIKEVTKKERLISRKMCLCEPILWMVLVDYNTMSVMAFSSIVLFHTEQYFYDIFEIVKSNFMKMPCFQLLYKIVIF